MLGNRPKGINGLEAPKNAPLDAADVIYRAGRFAEAEAAHLKTNELAPANAIVLERLGPIALWNNHLEETEHYLVDALRHNPWLSRNHADSSGG